MYMTPLGRILALASVLVLAGCGTTPPAPEPASSPEAAPPGDDGGSSCFTGGPWQLDLADYSAQAEPWMVGLGIPISDFVMTGSQTVQFTDDGLMSVLTDMVSTGILQTDDGPIPISVPSALGGSGDWSLDDSGRMTIANWTSDGPAPESADGEITPPVLDFSTISEVGVTCQPGLLSLTAPESPFVPLFRR